MSVVPIIDMPPNLFFGTSIATTILVPHKQQYECYRDKFLAFKRKPAAALPSPLYGTGRI